MRDFAVVDREQLDVDAWRPGPALVTEDTAVTVVYGDQRVRADDLGLLHVRALA